MGIVLFISVLMCLPLLQGVFPWTHDGLVHFRYVAGFEQAVYHGQIFVRWVPEVLWGYGSPLFNYYAAAFHAVAAHIDLLLHTPVWSFNLAIVLIVTLSGVSMYLLARTLWGREGGLVSAILYLLAPYHIVQIYVRGAYPEATAMIFLPLVFLGLIYLERKQYTRGALVTSAALAAMCLSHNLAMVMYIPFIAFFVIFRGVALKSRAYCFWASGALVLGLGLAAFFWMPAFGERTYTLGEDALRALVSFQDHFVAPWQLVDMSWGYGFSVKGQDDGMSFQLGLAHLVVIVGTCYILWRKRKMPRDFSSDLALFCLVCSGMAVILMFPASRGMWEWVPLLWIMSFPWRFLAVVAFFSSLLAGFVLQSMRPWWLKGILILLAVIYLPVCHPDGFLKMPGAIAEQAWSAAEFATVETRSAAAWLAPRWAQGWTPVAPGAKFEDALDGRAIPGDMRVGGLSYKLQTSFSEPRQVRFNTFYFPGWTVTVDGEKIPVSAEPQTGRIVFFAPSGSHDISVFLAATSIRMLAIIVSWAALAIWLMILISGTRWGQWRINRGGMHG